jgi:hypothetical protein
MKASHVMVDIETLGTTPGAAVLEIAAATFSFDGEKDDKLFTVEIDLLSSLAAGLTVEKETAAWHLSKDYPGHLRGKPLRAALIELSAWLGAHAPAASVWAWGMDFERSMLEAAFAAVGLPLPWPYYRGLDARTVWASAYPNEKHGPRKHRAADDVTDQIIDLREAMATLKGGKA